MTRTIYRTEKSFMEKVVDGAVDRLSHLAGEGPLRFQLAHGNIRPGSLALMIRDHNEIDPPHVMLNDNTTGMIQAAVYNPGVGTIDYGTGVLTLDRELVAGKLLDACYDFDGLVSDA